MTDNGVPPESPVIASAHEFERGTTRRVFIYTRGGWDDGTWLLDTVAMDEAGWRYVRAV